MRCEFCGGLVLWDVPIRGDGNDRTTCQECGRHNCQVAEPEPDEDQHDPATHYGIGHNDFL